MQKQKGKYIPCDNCGKIIYRQLSLFIPFKHHYCSRKCVHEAQQKKQTLTCRICGKEYQRKLYLINKIGEGYCSSACYFLSKKTGKYVSCVNCGKQIYREKARLKRSKSFRCDECKRGCSKEAIPKISQRMKELWRNAEFREKTLKGMHDPNHLFKLSQIRKENWKNLEYIYKARRNKRPNKTEISILSILKTVSQEWIFVGDWKIFIDGKNPDFWNRKFGLIEYYGDYWHKNDNPQERIDLFKKYGFDTLILKDGDFKDHQLLKEKITEFHNSIAKEEKL